MDVTIQKPRIIPRKKTEIIASAFALRRIDDSFESIFGALPLAFEIFLLFFDDLFNYSLKKDRLIINSDKIYIEHYLILFIFVEVIVIEIASKTGDKEINDRLTNIKNVIYKETDSDKKIKKLISIFAEKELQDNDFNQRYASYLGGKDACIEYFKPIMTVIDEIFNTLNKSSSGLNGQELWDKITKCLKSYDMNKSLSYYLETTTLKRLILFLEYPVFKLDNKKIYTLLLELYDFINLIIILFYIDVCKSTGNFYISILDYIYFIQNLYQSKNILKNNEMKLFQGASFKYPDVKEILSENSIFLNSWINLFGEAKFQKSLFNDISKSYPFLLLKDQFICEEAYYESINDAYLFFYLYNKNEILNCVGVISQNKEFYMNPNEDDIIGYAINTNFNETKFCGFQHCCYKDEPDILKNGYLFLTDTHNRFDIMKDILFSLFGYALDISLLVKNEITDKIDDIIRELPNLVNENINDFQKWIDGVTDSPVYGEEFTKFTSFYNAVGNLDTYLSGKKISDIKNKLKKHRNHMIPAQLRIDLLQANKDIELLYEAVRGEDDLDRKKIANNFFIKERIRFKIIKKEDFKAENFYSGPNELRDTRRRVLVEVAKRLSGIEYKASPLCKRLGVEEQKQKKRMKKRKK